MTLIYLIKNLAEANLQNVTFTWMIPASVEIPPSESAAQKAAPGWRGVSLGIFWFRHIREQTWSSDLQCICVDEASRLSF